VTAAASSTVPSVVGLSADDAASRLSRSGFVVERVDTGQAGTAGLVKSQSPTAGTMAASGSAVTVVVAPT
jgi:beta-lactam-binding protein with PASTA domain